MKVLILGQAISFDCVPRNYPVVGNTLTLDLRDENAKTVLSPQVTWMIAEKLRITLTTLPEQFISRAKFEIELRNGSEIIYKGKLIVLDANTDVQNYSNEKQSNSKFKYND